MGIISKLKSVLGVAGDDRRRSREGGTPVAVEREPAAEGERAVKGVESASGTGEASATMDAEPGSSTTETDRADGDPVESIKGIGTAYAERLAEAGVHTVADLAEADPDALAAETGLGSGRVDKWIQQARARSR